MGLRGRQIAVMNYDIRVNGKMEKVLEYVVSLV